jgi:PKD repeat protein
MDRQPNFHDFTDEKPNIDIEKVTYERSDGSTEVTLTIEVYGQIENRGSLADDPLDITGALDSVTYVVMLSTSEGLYEITYVNQKCQVGYPDETKQNITSFTVNEGTLQIKFDLTESDEIYEEMIADTYDIKLDISGGDYYMYVDFAYEGMDIIADAGGPYEGEVGESIQFQGEGGYLIPQPVEAFEFSWDFGDGTTSNQQNPTHSYNEAGNYTVNLTVSDETASSYDEVIVTITEEISGNGQSGDQSNAGLLLFIAIIAIIAIIGVVVLILIIRR